jgi:hypothetical protein
MKHRLMIRLAMLVTLLVAALAPGVANALPAPDGQQHNVNSRYTVESVLLDGIERSGVTASLRRDMQKLVGEKYDPDAAEELARRLRQELPGYTVDIKVSRGMQQDHVKVTFEVERKRNRRFDAAFTRLAYYQPDGFSGALSVGGETHHNYFSVGVLSTADELAQRNAGVRLRYEHRRVGTDAVQIGVEYGWYHQTFEPETVAAFDDSLVSPLYGKRRSFVPSVSLLPIPQVKLTFGTSLETLEMFEPSPGTERAYAFFGDVQLRHRWRDGAGLRHTIGADYDVRNASRTLKSDLFYTRNVVGGDYTLSTRRQVLGVRVQGGWLNGRAPLFERFMLGTTTMLRGWDKVDVAPLGGSRLAYASVEYRYRPFQIFWDMGTVWDGPTAAPMKHSLGIGLVSRDGLFFSVAFPVRLDHVTPVVMFGYRGDRR